MQDDTLKTGDKELIDQLKQNVKDIDRGRTEFKKQALINVMFLYGKQHLDLKSTYQNDTGLDQRIIWEIESIRKANNTRRVSNYILPLFRSLYSRLIRMKATINVNPLTTTERDRDAAKVSREIAENFFENCNQGNPWLSQEYTSMQPVLMKTVLYMLSLGNGYLFPYFNPKAETFVYDRGEERIFSADVGEAEVRVISPLNMFRDRFGRFFIERRFISKEQVFYEYDKEVKSTNTEKDLVEEQIRKFLTGEVDEGNDNDGVYVYTKFCLPEKKYSKGRFIVCTDNDILFNDNIPEEYGSIIPFFNCKYQDLGFTDNSQGAVEQVVDLQQDYNETLTRITSYKNNLSGKLLNPRGSKLSSKFDTETGQIINYNKGFKPSYESGAVIPSYIISELMRIRRDMEDLMNSHETSMGKPGGVKSGVAIDSLAENDYSMISPELITFEMTLSKFTECVVNIAQKKYIEPRVLSIAGDDMAYEVNSFVGKDAEGQKRVKIRMGSDLPQSRSEREDVIYTRLKLGLISPEQAKKSLEFADINDMVPLDETGAKVDILNIVTGKEGIEVVAEPFEDHTIRLKVINDFRKGSRYAKLDEAKKQAIDDLAQQHQNFLLSEMQASQGMGQGLPAPAMPQQ